VTRHAWAIRLSETAEADFDEIPRWTARRFGAAQAASYGDLLAAALARLERGAAIAGSRQRDEIGAGLRTLHMGRRGRHLILFRIGDESGRMIDVLRILHDAMDLERHAPREDQMRTEARRDWPAAECLAPRQHAGARTRCRGRRISFRFGYGAGSAASLRLFGSICLLNKASRNSGRTHTGDWGFIVDAGMRGREGKAFIWEADRDSEIRRVLRVAMS
jgi:toxin ParE1/3/4